MDKKQIPTQPWRAVIIAVVLVTALSACRNAPVETPASGPVDLPAAQPTKRPTRTPVDPPAAEPTKLPSPTPAAHSSPYLVMEAMIAASARGDHVAFSKLLAYDSTFNLSALDEIVTNCTGQPATDVPFDVEFEKRDLAAGQLGSLSGLYKVYMERFDGEWFISEIQGTLEACPF